MTLAVLATRYSFINKTKSPTKICEAFAESEGFEPPVPCGTMVFKTTAIDHSANSLYILNRNGSANVAVL